MDNMANSQSFLIAFFSIALLLLLSFLGSCKPKRISYPNTTKMLPVRKGFAGVRGVLKLRRSVILELQHGHLYLPKGTIVEDEYEPKQLILPESCSTTLHLGGNEFTMPKGGLIRIANGAICEVEIDHKRNVFNIGMNTVPFRQWIGSGLTLYPDSYAAREGHLKEDIWWKLNEKDSILLSKKETSDTEKIHHYLEGNIGFYPDGKLWYAQLRSSAMLKVGNQPMMVAPGLLQLYPGGQVSSCVLEKDLQYAAGKLTFTIPARATAYFNEKGELFSRETAYIEVTDLHDAGSAILYKKARLTLFNGTITVTDTEK